jgi:serine/threonine protein phosphatase PrpC
MGWFPERRAAPEFVVAVADGHGSPKCFRSHVGSRFGVEIGLSAGRVVLGTARDEDETIYDTERAARLARAIVERWRDRVSEDLVRTPLTDTELAGLEKTDGGRSREVVERSPVVAYGATLLLAVVARRRVMMLQVGDGDILLVSPGGQTHRPIPADPRLIGNETTSLSGDSAVDDFRFAVAGTGDGGPALMVLATDGFSNAYTDDDAFLQVGSDLLEHVEHQGVGSVAHRLGEWLETASRHDGDDVTVVVVSFVGPGATPAVSVQPAPAPRAVTGRDPASHDGVSRIRWSGGPARGRGGLVLRRSTVTFLNSLGVAPARQSLARGFL